MILNVERSKLSSKGWNKSLNKTRRLAKEKIKRSKIHLINYRNKKKQNNRNKNQIEHIAPTHHLLARSMKSTSKLSDPHPENPWTYSNSSETNRKSSN
jgi:hypothetical protein